METLSLPHSPFVERTLVLLLHVFRLSLCRVLFIFLSFPLFLSSLFVSLELLPSSSSKCLAEIRVCLPSLSFFLTYLLSSLLDATPPLSTTVDLLRFSPELKRDRHARQNGGERQPTKFEIAPCPSWLSASLLVPSNEYLTVLSFCLYSSFFLALVHILNAKDESCRMLCVLSLSVNFSPVRA